MHLLNWDRELGIGTGKIVSVSTNGGVIIMRL